LWLELLKKLFIYRNKKEIYCQPSVRSSLQPKGAGLLHGRQELLVQHGVRRIGRQIQAVEARVSPAGDGDAGVKGHEEILIMCNLALIICQDQLL